MPFQFSSSHRPKKNEDRDSVFNSMRTVYDIVVRTKNKVGRCLSDLFLNLPARSLYPDYFQLIRNPICLRDIEERLPEYKNESNGSEHFIKDFILVFDNARVYNREYSMIYNDSLTLENLFRREIKKVLPDVVLPLPNYRPKYKKPEEMDSDEDEADEEHSYQRVTKDYAELAANERQMILEYFAKQEKEKAISDFFGSRRSLGESRARKQYNKFISESVLIFFGEDSDISSAFPDPASSPSASGSSRNPRSRGPTRLSWANAASFVEAASSALDGDDDHCEHSVASCLICNIDAGKASGGESASRTPLSVGHKSALVSHDASSSPIGSSDSKRKEDVGTVSRVNPGEFVRSGKAVGKRKHTPVAEVVSPSKRISISGEEKSVALVSVDPSSFGTSTRASVSGGCSIRRGNRRLRSRGACRGGDENSNDSEPEINSERGISIPGVNYLGDAGDGLYDAALTAEFRAAMSRGLLVYRFTNPSGGDLASNGSGTPKSQTVLPSSISGLGGNCVSVSSLGKAGGKAISPSVRGRPPRLSIATGGSPSVKPVSNKKWARSTPGSRSKSDARGIGCGPSLLNSMTPVFGAPGSLSTLSGAYSPLSACGSDSVEGVSCAGMVGGRMRSAGSGDGNFMNEGFVAGEPRDTSKNHPGTDDAVQAGAELKKVKSRSRAGGRSRMEPRWADIQLRRVRVLPSSNSDFVGPPREGTIQGGRIECACCTTLFAASGFAVHGGNLSHRPFHTIRLIDDGSALADYADPACALLVENAPGSPCCSPSPSASPTGSETLSTAPTASPLISDAMLGDMFVASYGDSLPGGVLSNGDLSCYKGAKLAHGRLDIKLPDSFLNRPSSNLKLKISLVDSSGVGVIGHSCKLVPMTAPILPLEPSCVSSIAVDANDHSWQRQNMDSITVTPNDKNLDQARCCAM